MVTGCQFITLVWIATGIPGFEAGAYAAAVLGTAATTEYLMLVRKTVLESPQ
jgi:hypothetical protein